MRSFHSSKNALRATLATFHNIYNATNKIKNAETAHAAIELFKTVEIPDAIMINTLLRRLRDKKCSQNGLFLAYDVLRHNISDKYVLFAIMNLCIEYNSNNLTKLVERSIELGIVSCLRYN